MLNVFSSRNANHLTKRCSQLLARFQARLHLMETPLLQSRLVDSFAPRSVAATLRLYRLPRGFPACGVPANTRSRSLGLFSASVPATLPCMTPILPSSTPNSSRIRPKNRAFLLKDPFFWTEFSLDLMSRFSLPLTRLVHENLSIVMCFAYSRKPLEKMIQAKFKGEWKYLNKALFEISAEQAEKACVELALFLRRWS